jgi:hypothetical protein
MPRNISFALTTEQIKNRTKTITRRLGWWTLKPGTLLQPVEKCMGLKKDEKVKKIGGLIRVISTSREMLWEITTDDIRREGFPMMNKQDFCEFFLRCHKYPFLDADIDVNRIEFEYP